VTICLARHSNFNLRANATSERDEANAVTMRASCFSTTSVVQNAQMGRRFDLPGGELEYAVLSALWQLGVASGPDVHRAVGEPRGLVYTTIAKVLDRLGEKSLVRRKRIGRSFTYQALADRDTVTKARARDIVTRVLGDAPLPAMAALVDAVEAVNPDLIDELERMVTERRASRGGRRRGS
jgi:BlaI family penicillinase repressor